MMFGKIILRRGPSFDLPGQPIISYAPTTSDALDIGDGEGLGFDDDGDSFFDFTPPQQHYAPTAPLDEGEIAFSTDIGGLYVGIDPSGDFKQSNRLHFPYQNIEIINENSVDGFDRIHGESMREGRGSDYYSSPLIVTSQWTQLLINGSITNVFPSDVVLFVDYTITDQSGHRVRHGKQQVFGYSSGIEAVDEVDMIRLDASTYDPATSLSGVSLRANHVSGGTRLEYRNTTAGVLSMCWKFSQPV